MPELPQKVKSWGNLVSAIACIWISDRTVPSLLVILVILLSRE
jgi:hypothetical protein